jgi:hypothetical protein
MGSWTDTLPTGLTAGDGITDSALLGKILPLLDALTGAGTAYVPSWGATSAPSIGSGTIDGTYRRVGKWGDCTARIVGAGDTSWGSGAYSFGLPSGWSLATTGNVDLHGWAVVVDFSASQYYLCSVGVVGGDTTKFRVRPHGAGNLSATSLVTLATSDVIVVRVLAELA